jgi:microcystin-dependent protein
MSDPFIAEIKIFAGNFAPRGWALCNGQLLPIAQNTALFSLVGTTYGGDGRTTFGLPNLQGRLPVHPGTGPGLTNRRLGESGGSEDVTLSTANLPNHSHTVALDLKASSGAANTSDPRGNALAAASIYKSGTPGVDMDPRSIADATSNSGGGQAHENMPPYLTLNFIIALTGLFPSRS